MIYYRIFLLSWLNINSNQYITCINIISYESNENIVISNW